MHRYCAGVSVKHYGSLGDSPLPFNCSVCIQLKQAAVIDEMKSAIAALTAEVSELRAVLQATTSAMQPPTIVEQCRVRTRKWFGEEVRVQTVGR